jgi:hypothetical protein
VDDARRHDRAFSFDDLAPGEYFVLCSISFSAGGGQAMEKVAYARVMLAPGQVADVQVTRQLGAE